MSARHEDHHSYSLFERQPNIGSSIQNDMDKDDPDIPRPSSILHFFVAPFSHRVTPPSRMRIKEWTCCGEPCSMVSEPPERLQQVVLITFGGRQPCLALICHL